MANSKKALDENGVLYLWGKVKTYVATAIANIKLPSKTSDLTNDSGFITAKDVPEGAAASSTVPKMDGTATAGTETAFARGDHVHPSDTTKVDKVEGKGLSANDYTNEEKAKLGGVEANANNYTLPDASASVKGGVTVGTNVDVSGGKISVKNGTTNQKGVVQLSSATDDTSTTKAATPSAVKAAYDLAAGKQSPATSLAGYGIADAYTKDDGKPHFPKSQTFHMCADMQRMASAILQKCNSADGRYFETEYEERLKDLDEVIVLCDTLNQYINLSYKRKYISGDQCHYWAELVRPVRQKAFNWKRNDSNRAAALREAKANQELAKMGQMAQQIAEALARNP